MAWRERVHGGGGEHDQHGAGAGGQRGLRGVRAGCGGQGEHGRHYGGGGQVQPGALPQQDPGLAARLRHPTLHLPRQHNRHNR